MKKPKNKIRFSEDEVFTYAAFVQYFVLGRMNVSDRLYQQKGAVIERVAAFLRDRSPPKRTPLYRGWMAEPEKIVQGQILTEHQIPLSFTRDRDVACFFADPKSMISDFIAQMRPRARGYVMTLTGWSPSDVLWSYEWDGKIPSNFDAYMGMDLTAFGIGGISSQDNRAVGSNLKTQKELIMKPLSSAAKTTLVPLADAGCPPTRDLNARFGF
jgi:hypothetical protein